MAANSRNGNKRKRVSNSNPRADKKTDIKLSHEEFYRLSWELSKVEVARKNKELDEMKIKILGHQARILQLEKAVKEATHYMVKGKLQMQVKDYEKCKAEIAEKVGVSSLDEYILDDVTLELKHESKIEGNA